MAAGRLDILIEQGAQFQLGVNITDAAGNPVDLTGYTYSAKVRTNPADVSPLLTLTVAVLSAPGGSLSLTALGSATGALATNTSPVNFWDLTITSPAGVPTRVYQGLARFSARYSQ